MSLLCGQPGQSGTARVCKKDCRIYNSAQMTLEEVIAVMEEAESRQQMTVRLHTGDPSLYGAIREQIDCLKEQEISYDVTPGVSSFCGAAAALDAEYTLPGITQSVIITRMAGRTPVPEAESIASFAAHGCAMVIFLSAGMLEGLQRELLRVLTRSRHRQRLYTRQAGRKSARCAVRSEILPGAGKKPAFPKRRL